MIPEKVVNMNGKYANKWYTISYCACEWCNFDPIICAIKMYIICEPPVSHKNYVELKCGSILCDSFIAKKKKHKKMIKTEPNN